MFVYRNAPEVVRHRARNRFEDRRERMLRRFGQRQRTVGLGHLRTRRIQWTRRLSYVCPSEGNTNRTRTRATLPRTAAPWSVCDLLARTGVRGTRRRAVLSSIRVAGVVVVHSRQQMVMGREDVQSCHRSKALGMFVVRSQERMSAG